MITATELQQDIATGCLVEVQAAACSYDDTTRGLTARQAFFVYPDDTIVCRTTVDGTSSVSVLSGDDEVTFRSIYREVFAQ